MGRTGSLLAILLTLLVVAPSACKRTSALDTKAMRDWAENEGFAWIEGPDEIRTEQAFFDYINGAAQPIIDLGWKRSLFGILEKGETRLRLTMHEMRNPKAALALLEQNIFKDTEPIAIGETAIYWDRGAFSKGVFFQKGAVTCELILEKAGTKEELLGLASSLEALTE